MYKIAKKTIKPAFPTSNPKKQGRQPDKILLMTPKADTLIDHWTTQCQPWGTLNILDLTGQYNYDAFLLLSVCAYTGDYESIYLAETYN